MQAEHVHAARAATPDARRSLLARLCNCGHRGPSGPGRCRCVPVRHTPIERPDLAIYSQEEVLAGGGAPSWDSPDILSNHWAPFRLREEARVTARNLSPTTSAANALVHFYTSPFGIGMRRQLRLTRMVSIARASQVQLLFPLHQEVLAGDPRTGVHIVLEHPTDGNPVNNAGSQVHDGGYTSESGRSFDVDIPVLNDAGLPRQITLAVLPTDLVASVTPASRVFGPLEQVVATLHVEVPAFLVGTPAAEIHRAVTVIGRVGAAGPVLGGVTRLLRINN